MKIKDAIKKISLEFLVVDLLSAYAIGSSVLLLWINAVKNELFSSLQFTTNISTVAAVAVIVCLFALIALLRRSFRQERAFRYLLFVSMTLYFALLCYYAFTPLFAAILFAVCAVAAYYCFGRADDPIVSIWLPTRTVAAVVMGVSFVFFALESSLRYANMEIDNYDMGIYAQMFESLATTGKSTILTSVPQSCRFDSAPSLLLYPLTLLWMLFRNMVPFLILQAAALASGVVPLTLILKKRGAGNAVRLVAAAVYGLYPGIWNGAFRDFHEQCFLVPLVLWTLFFAEIKAPAVTTVCLILTAAVCPSGALIAFFIGVYILFAQRSRWLGVIGIAVGAIVLAVYFAIAPDLMVPDDAVIGNGTFFKILLTDPGYLLSRSLDRDKLPYLLLLFASIGFLPFITKRRGDLLLLAPVFVSCFLGGSFDETAFYARAFGSSALLMYLFIGAFEGMRPERKRFAAAFCTLACFLCFTGQILPQAHQLQYSSVYAEGFDAQRQAIEAVPAGSTVTASPKYTAYLTKCEDIFLYYPAEVDENGNVLSECNDMYHTDFTLLSLSGVEAQTNTIRAAELLREGFRTVYQKEGAVVVLQRPNK